jgi:hypothetical protein
MTLVEIEDFLNNESEDNVTRSLKDPWELDGDTLFNADTLLDTIMMKGGQLTPIYTNIANFYRMNSSWWNRHKLTFQKWWEVIDDEYTPLWDRDGFEETTDKTVDDGGTTGNKTSTEVMDDDTTKNSTTHEVMDDDTTGTKSTRDTDNGTTSETSRTVEVMDDDGTVGTTTSDTSNTTTSDNSTAYNYVSAFDSGYDSQGNPIYQPNTKQTTTASGTSNTTTSGNSNTTTTDDRTTTTDVTKNGTTSDTKVGSETTAGTDDKTTDTTYSETGTDDRTTTFNEQTTGTSENTRDYTHEHHSWGNWGITTTAQKLLEQELRIRAFDIYEHMADFFLDELCIRVYL